MSFLRYVRNYMTLHKMSSILSSKGSASLSGIERKVGLISPFSERRFYLGIFHAVPGMM